VGLIPRGLYCRTRTGRAAKMGGYLFFSAVVVDRILVFLQFDRADSVPGEFTRHVVRRVVDAARGGDGSFMATLVMARKGLFLSVP